MHPSGLVGAPPSSYSPNDLAFGGARADDFASFKPHLHDPSSAPSLSFSMAKPLGSSASQQQQSQYILELDPCSKCFQTMSPPYRSATLKDLQSDQKFTDSTSIYRLKGAYQLKSFSFNVHEAKGYKTVTKVTLYVNSVQDVDLAEMKNNWSLWQKVCDLNVDVTQKSSFSMTLPLPVTATNVLIEYHSVNLSKPVEFNSRSSKPSKYYHGGPKPSHAAGNKDGAAASKEVTGLDSVLALLPGDVSSKLTLNGLSSAQSSQEAGADGAMQ